MTFFQNTFEGGTDATAITTGNSGSTSGTAFDSVINTGGTTTYASAAAYDGGRGYSCVNTSTSANYVAWTTLTGSRTADVQFMMKVVTLASSGAGVCVIASSGGSKYLQLVVSTSGQIQLQDFTFGTIGTSAANISFNTWYRVAILADNSGGTTLGFCTVNVYAGESTTPFTSITVSAKNFGAANFNQAWLGKILGSAAASTIYFDRVALDTAGTSEIGPLLTVSAGSSVSCAAGGSATMAPVVTFGYGSQSYLWSILSGPSTSTSQLSSTTTLSPTFTPSAGVGTYVLQLVVTDSTNSLSGSTNGIVSAATNVTWAVTVRQG
jgi:hypothetical protein